eukprot:TRINITY_DN32423_c0_g1_i2.p1 TRINITY_DN32423_c0_g1~~TRINITY_DN32423_c0_g1_i2.p1  ORF type:complete len:141 (-),score=22.48 TRINITY_DN32423_c0_g1_i2:12-434(-)
MGSIIKTQQQQQQSTEIFFQASTVNNNFVVADQLIRGHLYQVIQNLNLAEDTESRANLTTQAQKLVGFATQLVLEKFPKDSKNADTFVQAMTNILSWAFQWVGDDVFNVVSFSAEEAQLDNIFQKKKKKKKKKKIGKAHL